MKLYLARHGDYILDTMKGLDVLSDKGKSDMLLMANFLKQSRLQVSNILHSSKNRAQQTADILAEGMTSDQVPQLYQGLNPNDDVSQLVLDISQWNDDVLLVGHLPFMGKLVSLLVTGSEDNEIVNFQTGTLVCLDQVDRTHWMISWIMTPDILNGSVWAD